MPDTTTPSTTGNTVAPQAPASTPAPSYGLTPASWAPQGKPQGNQDFSRFDKLERPNQTPPSSSNEELTDPDLEEGGEKILDIADIDSRLAPPPEKKVEKEDVESEQQTQEVAPDPTQQQNLPPQRDYTQFDEDGQKVLKKARNEVFAYAEKLNKSLKEVTQEREQLKTELTKVKEGRIPDSYLDHPEAYQLLPEYQTAVNDYQTDAFEENHWAQQLERIEQGLAWQNLRGYQDGKPVYETIPQRKNAEGEVIYDSRAKVEIMRLLNACSAARQNSGFRVQQVVGGFKQLHQQSIGKVSEFEHNSFPTLKEMKPELKADVDKIIKSLPSEIQRSPYASFIAKGSLLVGAQAQRIRTLEAELAAAKGQAVDRKAAGPTAKSFTAAGGSQEKMLDIKDFGD